MRRGLSGAESLRALRLSLFQLQAGDSPPRRPRGPGGDEGRQAVPGKLAPGPGPGPGPPAGPALGRARRQGGRGASGLPRLQAAAECVGAGGAARGGLGQPAQHGAGAGARARLLAVPDHRGRRVPPPRRHAGGAAARERGAGPRRPDGRLGQLH